MNEEIVLWHINQLKIVLFNRFRRKENFSKINLSNRFRRNYSSSSIKYSSQSDSVQIDTLPTLDPWWVTGFCDAESSFSMFINKSNSTTIGWTVSPCFNITLHIRDIETLKAIQVFFNVGGIATNKKLAHYRVRSRDELKVIIDHFQKYPLHTSKLINFSIFVEIYNMISEKTHTNVSGFLKVVALANKLNKPLSKALLANLFKLGKLPNVTFEDCSLNYNPQLNPGWISGFIAGEGAFTYFTRTRKNKDGVSVKDYTLVMEVSQKIHDSFVLASIQHYFNVGKVIHGTNGVSKYRLTIREEILEKLVPHISNYPLLGHKELLYSIWLEIVKILSFETTRSFERDNKIDNLINKLSNL